ncbi:MAG: hypothetical protein ABSF61_13380 [Anaerolineales bacterium]|jgi:hypothetical protein
MTSFSLSEAWNRGNNLLVVGVLAFKPIGVSTETFLESEGLDKVGDIATVLLAIMGLVSYSRFGNRFPYS